MWSRRQLLVAGGVWSAAPLVSGCSSGPTYDEVVHATWRHAPPASSERAALLRTLVRYATLAPSSHNTQCWRFRLQDQSIQIEPDLTRRCPVVDPDDHHVFVSLGCAAENLTQAAAAHGLEANGRFAPSEGGRYVVSLTSAPPRKTPLFEAIPERQCTRGDYDGQALSAADLRLLEEAGTGPGVRLMILTERQAMEKALEYVVAGNTAQMNDDAFVRELTSWIRFSQAEAVTAGDGLFSGASGTCRRGSDGP